MVLMEPQSRAFISQLVDFEMSHGATVNGWTEKSLTAAISRVRSSNDLRKVFQVIQGDLMKSYLQTIPLNRRRILVDGLYMAQGAYNAAVLHDLKFDASVRTIVAEDEPLDSAISGLADARQAFLATTPGDWKTTNAALSKMVYLVAGVSPPQ